MKLNFEPIKNWFGFSRRERRSAFIFLLIIILIIAIRFTVPEKNMALEDFSVSASGIEIASGFLNTDTLPSVRLFSFNPNTASYDTLLKLGFAPKEANTLISYRNKGGKFRHPSDIKKVYGIEEAKAEKLLPFVKVETDTAEWVRVKSYRQQKLKIDINSCDTAMLDRLPGIGPVLSARIIKYRHLLGGFARIDQLKEVYGLPEETYNIIKERIIIDTSTVTRIYINTSDYKELVRLPYFEKYEVNAILKYRELMGKVSSLNELVDNKVITKEKAAKIRPYLRFE
jgi:competence protein ComEA